MTMLYLMTSPEAVPVQIENALGSLLNSDPDDAHRQQGDVAAGRADGPAGDF